MVFFGAWGSGTTRTSTSYARDLFRTLAADCFWRPRCSLQQSQEEQLHVLHPPDTAGQHFPIDSASLLTLSFCACSSELPLNLTPEESW